MTAAQRSVDRVDRLAYSIDEAGEALGVTDRHIRNLIERGDIRSVKLGRRRVIPATVLEALLAGREVPNDAA